jgi:abequosyltransferase
MNKIILSICIPTYNRCSILDGTLKSLFSNPEFDSHRIEVIVSDNSSTDRTQEIVAKYPLVRYYRNSENLKDRNFSKVLSYATGNYIRLFNDTLSFQVGALRKMLDSIEENIHEQFNIFFYNNMFLNYDCSVIINHETAFLNNVSFFSSWIANFGCWRQDFNDILNKDKYWEFQFAQVDWCLRLVKNRKKSIIYFNEFVVVFVPENKGGYHLINAFVNNYLFVIKQHKISFITYETEKFRLCFNFLFPRLIALMSPDNLNHTFDTSGSIYMIFKKYWYEPYFYPMLVLFWLKKFFSFNYRRYYIIDLCCLFWF